MARNVVNVQVQGVKEFSAMLDRLEKKTITKIAKSICKQSMKPMLAAAKSNALALRGGEISTLLSKKLKIYIIKKRNLRTGHFGSKITFQPKVAEFVSVSKSGRLNYIPHAIEYGHAAPGAGGSGSKDVAAKPFIRPAFDSKKGAVEQLANKLVKKFIDSQENMR